MSTARAEGFVPGLRVEVVSCGQAAVVRQVSLELPAGSSLGLALDQSGLTTTGQVLEQGLKVGIWGRVRSLDTVLRDMDRVEVYRPLKVDPKEARRLRYRKHKTG
jgi:uncharacterized protein